jgi:hypothetical protein
MCVGAASPRWVLLAPGSGAETTHLDGPIPRSGLRIIEQSSGGLLV